MMSQKRKYLGILENYVIIVCFFIKFTIIEVKIYSYDLKIIPIFKIKLIILLLKNE